MTHIEFVKLGLHNRHIRFDLGDRQLSRVLFDDGFRKAEKSKRTHYTFIPTNNMMKWREAKKVGDNKMMSSLSLVVDIEEIIWGEPISGTTDWNR